MEFSHSTAAEGPALLTFLRRYGAFFGLAVAALVLVLLGFHVLAGAALGFAVAGLLGLALAGLAFPIAVKAERERSRLEIRDVQRETVRLADKNASLEAALHESDAILGAVRAHLMVIDQSYRIAARYSAELETIFAQRELGSENLLNVLQRILTDRLFRTARDYLGLLFDESKKERTILKINPLEEVELNVSNADGVPGLRYVHFSFRRIYQGDRITKVLVTVEDTTERTILERQLRDSEQKKVKQFELLLGILHVDPEALNGFLASTNEHLSVIDDALRASDFAVASNGQTALLRQRLDVVMARIHNVKGNASILRLEHFERLAHTFEQKIVELKNRSVLGGDDFLAVVVALSEFRNDLDDLQSLRAKLVGIQKSVAVSENIGDPLIASITELAQTLGKKFGKPIKVDSEGFDSRALPAPQRLAVKDVLIQLTRNSMVHGIESREERRVKGKSSIATIEIHPMIGLPPNTFGFTFRDDGRGLDTARIRARAVAVNLVAAESAAAMPDADIAGYIFSPGFSTTENASVDAGRGMGMNLVKQRVIDDCGGEITINSEAGRYCEFSFILPPAHAKVRAS
jgi:HPt (histidine-containing phosphotransfer) domain-containing protein